MLRSNGDLDIMEKTQTKIVSIASPKKGDRYPLVYARNGLESVDAEMRTDELLSISLSDSRPSVGDFRLDEFRSLYDCCVVAFSDKGSVELSLVHGQPDGESLPMFKTHLIAGAHPITLKQSDMAGDGKVSKGEWVYIEVLNVTGMPGEVRLLWNSKLMEAA